MSVKCKTDWCTIMSNGGLCDLCQAELETQKRELLARAEEVKHIYDVAGIDWLPHWAGDLRRKAEDLNIPEPRENK